MFKKTKQNKTFLLKHGLKLPCRTCHLPPILPSQRATETHTAELVCRFALTCTFSLTVALSGCDHTAFRPTLWLCCQSSVVPLGGGRPTDSHSFHTTPSVGHLGLKAHPLERSFLKPSSHLALAGRLEKPADSGYSPAMCQTLYLILHILTSVSPQHNL